MDHHIIAIFNVISQSALYLIILGYMIYNYKWLFNIKNKNPSKNKKDDKVNSKSNSSKSSALSKNKENIVKTQKMQKEDLQNLRSSKKETIK